MLPTRPNQINPSVEFSYKEEYTKKLILTKQEAAFFFIFFTNRKGKERSFITNTYHIFTQDSW